MPPETPPSLTHEALPQKGSLVEVKNPYDIFVATNNMNPRPIMSLGERDFKPGDSIKNVNIGLQRENDDITIHTKINLNPSNTNKDLLSELAKSHKDAEMLGGEFIIFGPNKTLFNFNIDSLNDMLEIKTGNIIIKDNQKIFKPGIKINQNNVINALEDTSQIIGTTMKKICELSGKPVPEEKLILHAPTEKMVGEQNKPQDIDNEEKARQKLLASLEIKNPGESFDKIGGNKEAKKELQRLSHAIIDPLSYRLDGLKPPKGILLYGPPGTGKTLLVKALASETDAQFLYLKGSSIYSKYIGDSEKFLEDVFTLARKSEKRTIVFLDEIDKITPLITTNSHEVTQRVEGTLQTILDGMEPNENFTVIAATNRLDLVSPAVIRPGRFDELLEVGLPKPEERMEIFDIHRRNIQNISNEAAKEKAYLEAKEKIDAKSAIENWDTTAKEKAYAEAKKIADTAVGPKLFEDPDFNFLLPETNGFSGADIAKIVKSATKERSLQKEKVPVDTELFKKCINKRKEEIKKQQTENNVNEVTQNSKYDIPIYE